METCSQHGIRVLEFDLIRQSVQSYCRSEEGGLLVAQADPCFDNAAHDEQKAKVDGLIGIMEAEIEFPSVSLPPVAATLSRLPKEGLCLDVRELYALGCWAEGVAEYKAFFKRHAARFRLPDMDEALPDCQAAKGIVFAVITKDGELKDLPEFRDIKRAISRLRSEIDALTSRYFQDEYKRSMLQSEQPTLRDGRTVLAVKANCKGRIKGIVHEVSASGQTVYIEPEDVLERNNDLVRAEARLQQEILRVLRETSDRLRPEAGTLSQAVKSLSYLDATLARARYSHANKNLPVEDAERGLKLNGARHPLLGPRAVPIDIGMDDKTRALIISGPNTGGKTVTLKTVGLFALMHQFGLRLPCQPGSCLPFFSGVYADIGDEQSLHQSLSTFSAHMNNVSAIVREAGRDSLVLLDELGSGTDPEEGSAIAMALLDTFLEAGSLTLVTSHHGILKNYGYSREGCQNASVDFNGETLTPTYRILMGVPGESHALDIALRNGLAPVVVRGARSYLAEERADVAVLIRGLKNKHREVEELEVERKARLKDAMEEQRKASLKDLQLRQKELELKSQGAQDLKRLLSESRKNLENLVRELKEGELTREKTLKVKQFIAELERTSLAEEEKIDALERDYRDSKALDPSAQAQEGFYPGMDVWYGKNKKRAKILRAAKKGFWLIETEMMKLTVSEAELSWATALPPTKTQVSVSLQAEGSGRALLEVDLRGMRLEEALKAVERQIDAAALSGLHEFGIIHGLGEGILQKGVREYLSRSQAVADFQFAKAEEGGFGKTNVKLRD
jgi:DNA mismatch repair protein MutS2